MARRLQDKDYTLSQFNEDLAEQIELSAGVCGMLDLFSSHYFRSEEHSHSSEPGLW